MPRPLAQRAAPPRRAPGSKKISASAFIPPFLTKPNDSTSTPARHVRSAGLSPVNATALANRAPSMWKPSLRASRDLAERGDLGGAIGQPIFGRIGDRQRHRLAPGGRRSGRARTPPRPSSGVTFAPAPGSRVSLAPCVKNPGAPASSCSICACSWHRIAPVGGHRAASPRQLAAVPVVTHKRAHLALEQLGKRAVEPLRPGVAVIGGVEPVGVGQRGHHGGAGGGGIVGEEAHRPRMAGGHRCVNAGKNGAAGED